MIASVSACCGERRWCGERMTSAHFGIDVLLADAALQARLRGRRLGLLAHPASMTAAGQHSLDALAQVLACV